MTDVMAELVGPARCKADILHGFNGAIETFGPPRADSMMAREECFPPERPDLRVHPIGSIWTDSTLRSDSTRCVWWLWLDSG
jgi:hypothetical protein